MTTRTVRTLEGVDYIADGLTLEAVDYPPDERCEEQAERARRRRDDG